ncbi:MAG: hypothetical protein V1870_05685 [Candidatus Aenigmatarchaeota archaeon]
MTIITELEISFYNTKTSNDYHELKDKAEKNKNSQEARIFLAIRKVIDSLKDSCSKKIVVSPPNTRAISRNKISSDIKTLLIKYGANILWSSVLHDKWRMDYFTAKGSDNRLMVIILIGDHKEHEKLLN